MKIEIKSSRSRSGQWANAMSALGIDYLRQFGETNVIIGISRSRAIARRNSWIEIELRISQGEETERLIVESHRAESSYTLISVTHAKFITNGIIDLAAAFSLSHLRYQIQKHNQNIYHFFVKKNKEREREREKDRNFSRNFCKENRVFQLHRNF